MSSHRDNHPLESALSACSGAALTTVFVTPLDVVKVRMQNPAQQASVAACEHTSCAGSSSTSVMLRVARHEGVASLWAGLQPGLVMSVPGTVLYFAAYEAARDFLRDRASQPTEQAGMFAGGGARLITATLVSPVEMMRTRMQADASLQREGMLGGAAALVRREGPGALWKGLSATLWRDVPFSCLYWFGYEALKQRARDKQTGELSLLSSFLCGAGSGALAAFLTTPFDVLKTRRQVADWTEARISGRAGVRMPGGLDVSTSTPSALYNIAKGEGFGALFAGVVPRVAKVAPSCAIMIASYEAGKSFFRRRREAAQPEASVS